MALRSKATTFCLFPFMLLSLFSHRPVEAKADDPDYGDALKKAFLFFEGQRSGKLPKDNRVEWRFNSALDDGMVENVDLSGGYYDAGDNVKFNFPMAFTTTMLGWAAIGHETEMGEELENARKAVRWGADYLLKCATATPGRLYAGCGDPLKDHNCWQRPEEMPGNRNVYYVNASAPGSDVAAETAAALAAGSIVFRDVDSNYSDVLIKTARKVYDFAYTYKGKYSDAFYNACCPFYCSYSGYEDELLWGAVWMYKATHEDSYYSLIKKLGTVDPPDIFSWDNKWAGAYILLARYALIANDTKFEEYKKPAESFVCRIYPNISTSTTNYTPGGLMIKLNLSDTQYASSITFLLVSYTNYMILGNVSNITCGNDTIISRHQIRQLAKSQVDYILGKNPLNMSYMVGFGDQFPLRIHHRGSSIPSLLVLNKTVECLEGFSKYLDAPGSNPNRLDGAIVGGPRPDDTFKDDRRDNGHTEPTTYIAACIVGSLAAFKSSQ